MATIESQFVQVEGHRLHCLVAGRGEPVLLLHGWPTNAQLWRHVMRELGEHRRVLALDLPGFGRSDKPVDVRYSFGFYQRAIDGALEQLGVSRLGLAVHDLGGPVGLYWAVHNVDRVSSLALLNTLVFPELSWAVKLFGLTTFVPGLRHFISSAKGIAWGMKLGVTDRSRITPEVARLYQEPFETPAARRALLKAAQGLGPRGLRTIAEGLSALTMPVRIIYGERDRILPDVASTMKRVTKELPHAVTTALPNVGHFLQEDAPDEVARLLTEFFAHAPS